MPAAPPEALSGDVMLSELKANPSIGRRTRITKNSMAGPLACEPMAPLASLANFRMEQRRRCNDEQPPHVGRLSSLHFVYSHAPAFAGTPRANFEGYCIACQPCNHAVARAASSLSDRPCLHAGNVRAGHDACIGARHRTRAPYSALLSVLGHDLKEGCPYRR